MIEPPRWLPIALEKSKLMTTVSRSPTVHLPPTSPFLSNIHSDMLVFYVLTCILLLFLTLRSLLLIVPLPGSLFLPFLGVLSHFPNYSKNIASSGEPSMITRYKVSFPTFSASRPYFTSKQNGGFTFPLKTILLPFPALGKVLGSMHWLLGFIKMSHRLSMKSPCRNDSSCKSCHRRQMHENVRYTDPRKSTEGSTKNCLCSYISTPSLESFLPKNTLKTTILIPGIASEEASHYFCNLYASANLSDPFRFPLNSCCWRKTN